MKSIGLIAAVTFVFNVSLVFSGHTTHAFYSPVPRTWELMVGAWLAVGHRHGVPWLSGWGSVQSWGGMILIIAGLVLIGPTSAFPGFWVLLPVLGTALVVNAGPNTFLNGRLLSWRPVVWVGLISYPLYLWHWALLSLVVIVFGDSNPTFRHVSRLVLVVASILLAWLTYRYFEGPVRRSRRRLTTVGLTVAVATLGVAGLAVYVAAGVPDRPASFVSVKAEQYGKRPVSAPTNLLAQLLRYAPDLTGAYRWLSRPSSGRRMSRVGVAAAWGRRPIAASTSSI